MNKEFTRAIEFIIKFVDTYPKIYVFTLAAAVGCFIAALLAELFLLLTTSSVPPQMICLTIDVSSSMAGNSLTEVKEAAKKFVNNRNLKRDRIAITIFSTVGKVLLEFSQDNSKLVKDIDSLLAIGGTNFEEAIKNSESVVTKVSGNRSILLFTDGVSSVGDPMKAVKDAENLRKQGIRIFAISTPDADEIYLEGITGDSKRVIKTSAGNFEDAFSEAEKMISASQLMESDGGYYTYHGAIIRVSIWTVFLCFGIALFIYAVQNRLLKKSWITSIQLTHLSFYSFIAGFAAGFIGQVAHTIFVQFEIGYIGRIGAWTILGVILARGITTFIPNVDQRSALIFGAMGGFLGALGFVFMSYCLGDVGGRLLGAFILGACIGLLIAVAEKIYRNVWLTVIYDPRNIAQVNLGSQPVSVGSGKNDTIFIDGVPASAAVFSIDGNNIRYKNSNGLQTLAPGAKINIGTVEFIVCSKDTKFSASKFYPMKMSRARELMSQ
jgi:Ca-activated chloride channel family protein